MSRSATSEPTWMFDIEGYCIACDCHGPDHATECPIADLEARLAASEQQVEEWRAKYFKEVALNEPHKQQAQTWKAALERYGRHEWLCDRSQTSNPDSVNCTCGLAAALNPQSVGTPKTDYSGVAWPYKPPQSVGASDE